MTIQECWEMARQKVLVQNLGLDPIKDQEVLDIFRKMFMTGAFTSAKLLSTAVRDENKKAFVSLNREIDEFVEGLVQDTVASMVAGGAAKDALKKAAEK